MPRLTHQFIENPDNLFPVDHLLKAIEDDNIKSVKEMLAKATPEDLQQVTQCASYLHKAAYKGNFEIIKMLINSGTDANILDDDESTALNSILGHVFRPLQDSDMPIIDYLIKKGTDVNRAGLMDSLPLYEAVGEKNKALVLKLLAAGAEIAGDDPRNLEEVNDEAPTLRVTIERLLGDQMPDVIKVRNDNDEKPVYRQMAPNGKPVSTISERDDYIKKNPNTNKLVALSLFKRNEPLADVFSAWGIAREWGIPNIGAASRVTKIENNQGKINSEILQGVKDESEGLIVTPKM